MTTPTTTSGQTGQGVTGATTNPSVATTSTGGTGGGGGGGTATIAQLPPVKPNNPKMGTTEETFRGSGDFYYAFGGEPLPDWSAIKDLSSRLLSDLCFRSVDPVSGQKSSVIRTKGLSPKYQRKDKLAIFQKQVWSHLKKHGLDTIGYLQDPNDSTQCLSVVTHHARFTSDLNKAQSLSDIFKKEFDTWDKKHDFEAKTFLLASLNTDLLRGLETYLEDEDTFAVTWLKFVRYLVVTTTRTFDMMRESLRNIRPQTYEGQNIEKMAETIINTATELDHAGHFDHNLTLNIVDAFLCASKDSRGTFHHTMNNLRSRVETLLQSSLFLPKTDQDLEFAKQKLTYTDVCMYATDAYKVLKHDNMWEPAKLPKDSQRPARIGLTSAEIMLLKETMSNNKGHKKNGRRSDGNNSWSMRGCFNCGSKDHMIKDCPHLVKGNKNDKSKKFKSKRHRSMAKWKLIPPSNPNETKLVNGKTYHFCTKCGNWTPTHTTNTHTGGKPTASGEKPSNEVQSNHVTTDPGVWFVSSDLQTVKNVRGSPTGSPSCYTELLLKAYLILSVLLACGWVYWQGFDSHCFYMNLKNCQEAALLMLPLIKNMLPSALWFWIGYGVNHLHHLNKERSKFNAVRYSVNMPHRRYQRMKHKTSSYKVHQRMSAKRCHLHRSYPLKLRNDNKFTTRRHLRNQHSPKESNYEKNKNQFSLASNRFEFCRTHNRFKRHNNCKTNWRAVPRFHQARQTVDMKDCFVYKPFKKVNKTKKHWSPKSKHKHSQHMNSKKVSQRKLNVQEWTPVPVPMSFKARKVFFTPKKVKQYTLKENHDSFQVIWDSGASVCITPCRKDFVSYSSNPDLKTVKTMGGATSSIRGEGIVTWFVHDNNGLLRQLRLKAYHIPSSTTRLLSTSALLGTYQDETITVNSKALILSGSSVDTDRAAVTAYNHVSTNLPTTIAYRHDIVHKPNQALANIVHTVDSENHNLNESEKELLRWHYRLGHLAFKKIQHLMRTGVLCSTESKRSLHTTASKIVHPPKCAACLFGKQVVRSTKATTTTVVTDRAGVLRDGNILPGAEVSVDHFVSSVKGRLFTGYDKGTDDSRYVGGCIFVDHSSSYIHIELQSSLSSHDTLRAKAAYKASCRDYGVVPKTYTSDNGKAFTSQDFTNHLANFHQITKFAGVGAHHQNAIAERSIRTIMSIARTMMMHAAIHWPDVAQTTLWPMAVSHACFLWNHVPNPSTGLSPHDLFARTRWPQRRFHDSHVWGCPTYVLDKAIQDGKKIPKWEPRSDRHIYVGTSRNHASSVPLILNTRTGYLSPQFHIVFDDWFATVGADKNSTPDFTDKAWTKMFGSSIYQYGVDEDGEAENTDNTEAERIMQRQDVIDQQVYQPSVTESPTTTIFKDTPPSIPSTSINTPPATNPTSSSRPREDVYQPVAEESEQRPLPSAPPLPETSEEDQKDTQLPSSPSPVKKQSSPQRKSSPIRKRPKRNIRTPTRLTYTHNKRSLTHESNLVVTEGLHSPYSVIFYCDKLVDGSLDYTFVYTAKQQTNPDIFDYDQAMNSEHKDEFIKAAQAEIEALVSFDCWEEVPLSVATTKVLPGTWAFRIKRAPDGTLKKFKARYCIRGDLQEGVFETYAPVVQLSTVRLFLAWALLLGWTTCCVDFSNAFIQAKLDDEIFVHVPRGFVSSKTGRTCLKLKRSLYGLSVAPRLWFKHLWKALDQEGLKPSDHDPCLMFRKDLVVIQYVDDLGLAAKDMSVINELLDNLKGKGFELTKEGTFTEYLGIQYTNMENGSILMNQPGLIQKIIDTTGMKDCNPNRTPTTKEALGMDLEGKRMTESWNYRSIVGMLLYLSTNTRPDISFAVSQVARFSHNPKQSHATAVKTIVRYLSGTKEKGTIFHKPKKLYLDCFVDADFAGLHGRDPPEEPSSAKSRTGYIMSLAGCYILSKSQLQSTIALSTSEAEYGALSQAMRVLLPMREMILEFIKHLQLDRKFLGSNEDPSQFKTTIYEDNSTALSLATTQKITSRTKHWSIKWHFFWSHLNDKAKNLFCIKVDSKNQRADYLTKGLSKDTYEHCRKLNQGW